MDQGALADKVNILIISTQSDLTKVEQFLHKRNFFVTVRSSLRDGITCLTDNRPDWVFLSLNLSPMIDKFSDFLKQSFKIEPIVFADILDRNSVTRLEQWNGPSVNSNLTGPSIQHKLSQLVFERPQNGVAGSSIRGLPQTQGERPSTMVHMKGGSQKGPRYGTIAIASEANHLKYAHASGPAGRSTSVTEIPTASSELPPPTTTENLSQTERKLLTQLQAISLGLQTKPVPSDFKPVEDVEQLNVMVWEDGNLSGYLVMGGSLDVESSVEEAAKIQHLMTLDKTKETQEKLSGSIQLKIEDLPAWAALRSRLVQRYVTGGGEMLSCFVAESKPLPTLTASPTDKEKIEVRLEDIPTDVALPCPIFIHLPQNNKYVCLIKAEGFLSATQQERLIKMGASSLVIAKDDAKRFNLFFVREKLALLPPDEN